MKDNIPIYGCNGCITSGGRSVCPEHRYTNKQDDWDKYLSVEEVEDVVGKWLYQEQLKVT